MAYFTYKFSTNEPVSESNNNTNEVVNSNEESSVTNDSDVDDQVNFNFRQIGYYKSDENHRVFTYLFQSTNEINLNNISTEIWDAIEQHGLNQMNTSGRNTQSFYYVRRENIPDVTLSNNFEIAINRAYDNNPIAVVYIQFDGQTGISKFPD